MRESSLNVPVEPVVNADQGSMALVDEQNTMRFTEGAFDAAERMDVTPATAVSTKNFVYWSGAMSPFRTMEFARWMM